MKELVRLFAPWPTPPKEKRWKFGAAAGRGKSTSTRTLPAVPVVRLEPLHARASARTHRRRLGLLNRPRHLTQPQSGMCHFGIRHAPSAGFWPRCHLPPTERISAFAFSDS